MRISGNLIGCGDSLSVVLQSIDHPDLSGLSTHQQVQRKPQIFVRLPKGLMRAGTEREEPASQRFYPVKQITYNQRIVDVV